MHAFLQLTNACKHFQFNIIGIVLQPLLASDLNLKDVAILFGAGISLDTPSATPLGAHLTRCLLQNVLHDSCQPYLNDFLTSSDIQSELGLYLRFEMVCGTIERHAGNLDFLQFFSEYRSPNANHEGLVELSKHGATLLTTNFDSLVEISANNSNFPLKVISLTETECVSLESNTLYKLHGNIPPLDTLHPIEKIATTIKSVSHPSLTNTINRFLQSVLTEKHLIVVGYSGFDDFDVSPAITSIRSDKHLIWINHDSSHLGSMSYEIIGNIDQKSKPKSMILCEKLLALSTRETNKVNFVNCHTGEYLKSLTNLNFKLPEWPTFSVNYQRHIENWAASNLYDLNRRAISVDLLLALEQYGRAYEILRHEKFDEISNTPHGRLSKHLLIKRYHCLAKLPNLATSPEIDFAIQKSITQGKSDDSEIDLLTNIGIFLQSIDKRELAKSAFKNAVSLFSEEIDSGRKVRVEFNLLSFSETLNEASLLGLLERAKLYGEIYLLPSVFFQLACIGEQKYYLNAVAAATLVGDRDIFLMSATRALSLTDKYRSLLITIFSDTQYIDDFSHRNPLEAALFYGLVGRYFADENLPNAVDAALRGWEILVSIPEVNADMKAFYACELTDIFRRVNARDKAIDFLNDNFHESERFTDPFAKFNILSQKYLLAPTNESSETARSFALLCIESVGTYKFSDELYAALGFLMDTGNNEICYELASKVLENNLEAEEFNMISNLAGEALFNLNRLQDAKAQLLLPFQRFPQLKASNSALLFNLARIELKQGHLESAARLLFCSDELGDRTLVTSRKTLRGILKQALPESQLSELLQEITLKFKYSHDLEECLRELIASTGLLSRA